MANRFTINVSPDMAIYNILQAQSYGEATALSEFVDNSIQSFIDHRGEIRKIDGKNSFLLITISINTKTKTIIIEDNAAGIPRERLQHAMKMGLAQDESRSSDSLSVYGMGLKSAAVWFSGVWQLETSCIGSNEKISFLFNLNDLLTQGVEEVDVIPDEEDVNKHYTRITIFQHDRDDFQKHYEDTVLPFLQETFFKFKEFTEIKIILDETEVTPNLKKVFLYPYPALKAQIFGKKGAPDNENSRQIEWEKDIDSTANNKKVSGFIRLMEKGSYGQPGIRLLRNGRVIQGTSAKPNLPASITGTKNKFAAQRLYGEIHLDDFIVNYQKTDFKENLSTVYAVIKKVLEGKPKDIIAQADNYRAKWEPSSPPSQTNTATASVNGDEASDSDLSQDEAEDVEGSKTISLSEYENPEIEDESIDTEDQIKKSAKVQKLLGKLKHSKLPRLYKSLCKISLSEHPILMYVGAWSFFESLSAAMGRNKKVKEEGEEKEKRKRKEPFHEYFSGKIDKWFEEVEEKNDINNALEEIGRRGNANKHSAKGQAMTAQQLHNDFETLEGFIIKCLEEVIKKQPKA